MSVIGNPITLGGGGGSDLLDMFISESAGDYMDGWYGDRAFTRTLADGPKLVAAPYRLNNGSYVSGAFYTLVDYGDYVNVGDGSYSTKKEIPGFVIPDYGTATVYVYGGMNGGGSNASVNFYKATQFSEQFSNSGVGVIMKGSYTYVGSDTWFGPTTDTGYGTAFNSMSDENKEMFFTALLKTLNS